MAAMAPVATVEVASLPLVVFVPVIPAAVSWLRPRLPDPGDLRPRAPDPAGLEVVEAFGREAGRPVAVFDPV
jgi:hypothetical protein